MIFEVTDPTSGVTLELQGDSPPTELELEEIFSSFSASPAQPSAPADLAQSLGQTPVQEMPAQQMPETFNPMQAFDNELQGDIHHGNFPKLTKNQVGTSSEGKPVFANELDAEGFESESSERSAGMKVDDKVYNIPTIIDGQPRTPKDALDIIRGNRFTDPDTGRKITPFDNYEDANQAARTRSAGITYDRKPSAVESVTNIYGQEIPNEPFESKTFDKDRTTGQVLKEFAQAPIGAIETAAEFATSMTGLAADTIQGTSAVITDFFQSMYENDPNQSMGEAILQAANKFPEEFGKIAEEITYIPQTDAGKEISDATLGNISRGAEGLFKEIDEFAENKTGAFFGGKTPDTNPVGAAAFTTASKAAVLLGTMFGGKSGAKILKREVKGETPKPKKPFDKAKTLEAALNLADRATTPFETANALRSAEGILRDGKLSFLEAGKFKKRLGELQKKHGVESTAEAGNFTKFVDSLKEKLDTFLGKGKEEVRPPNKALLKKPEEGSAYNKKFTLKEEELAPEQLVNKRIVDIGDQLTGLKKEITESVEGGDLKSVERKSKLANQLTKVKDKLEESLLLEKPDPTGQKKLLDDSEKIGKLPEGVAKELAALKAEPVNTTPPSPSIKSSDTLLEPLKRSDDATIEQTSGTVKVKEGTLTFQDGIDRIDASTKDKYQRVIEFDGKEIPTTDKIDALVAEHGEVESQDIKAAIKQEIEAEVEKVEAPVAEASAEKPLNIILDNKGDRIEHQVTNGDDVAEVLERKQLVSIAKQLGVKPGKKKTNAQLGGAIFDEMTKRRDKPKEKPATADPKLVSEDGSPRTVFHTTNKKDIAKFSDGVIYFSRDADYMTGAMNGLTDGTIISANLDAKNLKTINDADMDLLGASPGSPNFSSISREEMIEQGFDGAVNRSGTEFAVFKGDQVKQITKTDISEKAQEELGVKKRAEEVKQAEEVKKESTNVELKKITEAPQPKKQFGGKESDLLLNRPLKNGDTKLPFEYGLKERTDVIASNKANFSVDERFPLKTQDRLRENDTKQQARLEQMAGNPELGRIFTDNPTAGDGLPMTVNGSIVAGGNGRKILLDKLVEERGQGEMVKQAIIDNAEKFGFTKEQVAEFDDPIITRDLKVEVTSLDEFRDIVSALNEDSSASLSTSEKSVSQGRRISEETADFIGRLITEGKMTTKKGKDGAKDKTERVDKTLNDALKHRPAEVLEALIKDGVFSESQRGQLFDAAKGDLTPQAKTDVANAMLGAIIEDAKLLETMPANIREKVVATVPSFLKVSTKGARDAGFDITEDLKIAVENASAAYKNGARNSADHFNQTAMFPADDAPPMGENARALFVALMDVSATKVGKSMRQYASDATDAANGQGSMFGGSTPSASMKSSFGNILGNERGSIDLEKMFSYFKNKGDETAELSKIKKAMTKDPLSREIWETLEKNEVELMESRKATPRQIYRAFNRALNDVSGNVRAALDKTPGGFEALVKFDAILGAPAEAALRIEKFHKDVLDQFSEAETTTIQRMIKARRNIDIATRNPEIKHEGGFTGEEYAKFLEQFPREILDKYNDSIESYFSYMREQLGYLLEEGLIDRKAFDRMVESDYSPRLFEQYIDPLTNTKFDGSNVNVTNSGLARLTTGSIQAMESDIRSLSADYTGRIWSRIFKNRANREMYKFARNNPDNGFVKPFSASKDAPSGWVKFEFMEKGKPQSFILEEEFAGEWIVRDPLIGKQMASSIQWLSGTKTLKASATSYNPLFVLTNFPRDLAHIWAVENQYSVHPPIAIGQMAVDFAETLSDAWSIEVKGAHREVIAQGMGMNFITQQGEVLKKSGAIKMVKGADGNWTMKQRQAWVQGIQMLQDVLSYTGSRSELHARLMLRNRAIKNGLTKEQATWLARRYLDFGRGGSVTKALDNVIPYLNAAMRASMGMVRAAEESKSGKRGASKKKFFQKMAWLGGLTVGLTAANRQMMGEDYENIPSDIRARYWIVGALGIRKKDEYGRWRYLYFKIPKDQGQALFSQVFEQGTNYMLGHTVDGKAMEIAVDQSSPVTPGSFEAPVQAWYDAAINGNDSFKKDKVFKGQPVEPWAEYYPWTHPLAKKVGELTSSVNDKGEREGGWSPERQRAGLGKLIAQSNPIFGVASQAMRAFMDDAGEEVEDQIGGKYTNDYFNKINHKSTFSKKLFGWTDPKSNSEQKEIVDKAERQTNTRRKVLNERLAKASEKSVSEAKKVINTAPPLDRKRLRNKEIEGRKSDRKEKIPAQDEIKALQYELPETAARAFEAKFEAASPEQKVRLNNALRKNKSVNTKSFKKYRRQIQRSRK